MSLSGEINKISGGIRESVERIARGGMSDRNGIIKGTKKIFGYVCNIHEDDELAGTVDVQEFGYDDEDYDIPGAGHHKGVLLSALQDQADGFLIVPMLFSEVVIVQNPLDGTEYVMMYSHARRIRMHAKSQEGADDGNITIGVTEVEAFQETDEGVEKDCSELEPTGNAATTVYSPSGIVNTVTSKDDENGLREETTAAVKTIQVGDTKITIDGQNVTIESSGAVSFKIGGTEIKEEDGKITVNTQNAKIESSSCEVKGDSVKVEGTSVTITGGTLKTAGTSSVDLNGPYNAIKVCPFSGAPHCGSTVTGT